MITSCSSLSLQMCVAANIFSPILYFVAIAVNSLFIASVVNSGHMIFSIISATSLIIIAYSGNHTAIVVCAYPAIEHVMNIMANSVHMNLLLPNACLAALIHCIAIITYHNDTMNANNAIIIPSMSESTQCNNVCGFQECVLCS